MRIRPVRRAAPVPALVVVLTGLLAATACGSSAADDSGTGKLKVVATTTQVADFARNIGGDKVTVTQILGPTSTRTTTSPPPPTSRPSPRPTSWWRTACSLEKWLDQTIKSAGFHGTLVDTSQGVAVRAGDGTRRRPGDPHIWHNPQNAKIMSREHRRGLRRQGPRRQGGLRREPRRLHRPS